MKDSFCLQVLLESNKLLSIFHCNTCLKGSNSVVNLELSRSCRLRLPICIQVSRPTEPMFINLQKCLTQVIKVMLIVLQYIYIPPDLESKQLRSVYKFLEEMDTSMNIHVEDY